MAGLGLDCNMLRFGKGVKFSCIRFALGFTASSVSHTEKELQKIELINFPVTLLPESRRRHGIALGFGDPALGFTANVTP
jgi:hypothetical protein